LTKIGKWERNENIKNHDNCLVYNFRFHGMHERDIG
jgi:hypothetical protein